jgi:hypothetical protein
VAWVPPKQGERAAADGASRVAAVAAAAGIALEPREEEAAAGLI